MSEIKYGCAICSATTMLPALDWLVIVNGNETTWRCPEHKYDK